MGRVLCVKLIEDRSEARMLFGPGNLDPCQFSRLPACLVKHERVKSQSHCGPHECPQVLRQLDAGSPQEPVSPALLGKDGIDDDS